MEKLHWEQASNIISRAFTCGYCGASIASEKGWLGKRIGRAEIFALIYICHKCGRPTLIDETENGKQTPGVTFGNPVSDIPEKTVETLYSEARQCTGAGAYTAAVLCCRKLLMHIAVSKGAKTGESFISYVEYLADHNYIPPDAKDWVDHIRKKSNEANHEISIMNKPDAEELLSFLEMLLKVIFEFPASIKKKLSPKNNVP